MRVSLPSKFFRCFGLDGVEGLAARRRESGHSAIIGVAPRLQMVAAAIGSP